MFLYILLFCNLFYLNHVNTLENNLKNTSNWTENNDWYDKFTQFGQISAVSLDNEGHVVIFHRGDRIWNEKTFSPENIYNDIQLGPIANDTIVEFNRSTGVVTKSWGSYNFYIPHGLTIDFQGNYWLTDVALHQIFKFNAEKKQLLQLGEKFVPGSDMKHFCKPTSIAVLKNGDFFVADGYCNSRILKYSAEGKLLTYWGSRNYPDFSSIANPRFKSHYTMAIPHALALVEDLNQLCVADRENGRILCFDSNNGSFVSAFEPPLTPKRVFSVAYAPVNGHLYIVNGPSVYEHVGVYVYSVKNKKLVTSFGNLSNPHDIAVNGDGSEVYVVEINPFLVHKYTHEVEKISIEKSSVKEKLEILDEPNRSMPSVVYMGIFAIIALIFIVVLGVILFSKKKKGTVDLVMDRRKGRKSSDEETFSLVKM